MLKTEISFFYIVFTSLKVMQQLTSKKQKKKKIICLLLYITSSLLIKIYMWIKETLY